MDLLINDIKKCKSCISGDIAENLLDKLLLKKNQRLKADINIIFRIRKKAVVNDS
jgi:hypothetical protein